MFTFILLMIIGGVCGYFLRRITRLNAMRVITWLVWALLLLLGIEVGANDKLMSSLHTIGLSGAVIAFACTAGSCLLAWILWNWVKKGMKSQEHSITTNTKSTNSSMPALKSGVVIVGFFIAGMILGYFKLVADTYVRDLSFIVLCVMLFCVGYGLGSKPHIIRRFKTLNPRLALLPIATIVGTLLACAALSLFMDYSMPSILAIGSGFGYYSLSSILISQNLGAELGTIALLCNIVRELITLLGAPVLAVIFGKLAPISAGGATTGDSTLPIIMGTLGEDFVLVSMFHGFLVDFSVPFLVTFFCSLA